MSAEKSLSCVEPVGGPLSSEREGAKGKPQSEKEVSLMTARVGKEAPDFEARALVVGGFKSVKLSDYQGQWVLLCFYPSDFTFV